MPAKLTLICVIHSITERDSLDFVIREAIVVLRKEDNTTMDIRITSFFPKKTSTPKWIPNFAVGDVVRFTGKFALDEPPHNNILEMTANAGDLIDKLTKDDLPISSISVFVVGFLKDQAKNDDDLFKSIKISVSEFIGNRNPGNKFDIKCRYVNSDERIDRKVIKARKNSSLMITGELISVNSEFQIDIQDINFLSTSNANFETSTENSGSSYSWSTATSSGRLSAQAMANNRLSTLSSENSFDTTNTITLQDNPTPDTNDHDDEVMIDQESNINDEEPEVTSTANKGKKRRTTKRKKN